MSIFLFVQKSGNFNNGVLQGPGSIEQVDYKVNGNFENNAMKGPITIQHTSNDYQTELADAAMVGLAEVEVNA